MAKTERPLFPFISKDLLPANSQIVSVARSFELRSNHRH